MPVRVLRCPTFWAAANPVGFPKPDAETLLLLAVPSNPTCCSAGQAQNPKKGGRMERRDQIKSWRCCVHGHGARIAECGRRGPSFLVAAVRTRCCRWCVWCTSISLPRPPCVRARVDRSRRPTATAPTICGRFWIGRERHDVQLCAVEVWTPGAKRAHLLAFSPPNLQVARTTTREDGTLASHLSVRLAHHEAVSWSVPHGVFSSSAHACKLQTLLGFIQNVSTAVVMNRLLVQMPCAIIGHFL